tara:strand:- start:2029 stop:2514 length:486 start_codon:yes stop_codon:yes gene_type:complete
VILRAACGDDGAAVAALWNGMIADTLFTFTTDVKTAAEVEDLIAVRADQFWVAEADGNVGFVTFGPFRSGPGYRDAVEHSIVLDSSVQGTGVGRGLMQTAFDAAAAQGRRIMVAAISGANPSAVGFHTALGFDHVGRMPRIGQKNGQQLDLILMQKMLSPR